MRARPRVLLVLGALAIGAACKKGGETTAPAVAASSGDTQAAQGPGVMACLPVARCGAWEGRGQCAALRNDGTIALPPGVEATAGAVSAPEHVCPGDPEAASELQACMDYVETQHDCRRRPRTGVPPFQCVRVHGTCEVR